MGNLNTMGEIAVAALMVIGILASALLAMSFALELTNVTTIKLSVGLYS